ncbi:MAG: hypothetical protein U5M51_04770, partial [Emticicia sp.]|nr:hypothetical protein [Emticicia sp.]
LFSFFGLAVAFLSIKKEDNSNQKGGLANIIYYLIVFTSDAFYPVGQLNPVMQEISDWLPMNPILNIMRGNDVNWLSIVFWLTISITMFSFLFKRLQSTR